jgi:hypothetical protein
MEQWGNVNPTGEPKYSEKNEFTGSLFTKYSAWNGSGMNSGCRVERIGPDHVRHDPAEKMFFATGVSEFQFVSHSTYFSSTEITNVLIWFQLAVNDLGLLTITVRSFHSEGDVFVLTG